MNNGLSGIKNIIWALAIVVALAAVLVGLIITMVLGFGGQRQDGTLYLGESSGLSSGSSSRNIKRRTPSQWNTSIPIRRPSRLTMRQSLIAKSC